VGLRVRAADPTFHAVFDILNGEAGGRSAFVRLTAGHARPRDGGERHPHEHQGVDRMWDFWSRLFDPSGFPARWRCGSWTPGHGWLHILSDVGIWSAYFVIPCVLGYYAVRRRGIPFRGVLVLFVAFILSCGLTHLMEAAIFWWPAYRLAGILKLLTAVVSWATVFALVRVTPQVMAFRSPAELEAEIAERLRAEGDLRALQAELEEQVGRRTAELEGAVAALKAEVEERKGVERRLRESREQLRLVTDNAPLMLVHCDADRRYRFVNRAYAEINDLSPQDVLGKTIPEVVGERAYELLRANADIALSGGRVDVEVESPYRGSEKRWLRYSFVPHHSNSGSVEGFLVVILDVTERRNAELLLRTIMDTVPALIAYVDREGRYRLNNRAYEQWFDHARSDMVGRHMRDVLGESAWPVIKPRFETALAGHAVRYEASVPYKSGGVRWIDATYTPHLDAGGEVDGVVSLVNDITDRKKAETALRESEGLFRQLANAMPQIVWMTGPDGLVDYQNDRWYEYTGQPRAGGGDESWKLILHPDDSQPTFDAWDAAVHSGRHHEIEHRFKNAATGEYRWHISRAVPVQGDAGGVVRWFGTSTDVHDKRLAEEALREVNATLEDRVARRGAEVEQRAKELRDQTRLLEPIVNSIAEGVVVADENGKFLLFNPAAERLLGVPVTDSPVAEWSRTYGVFLPDGQAEFPPDQLPLARAIRGEPTDDVEMVVRNPKQPEGIVLSVTGRPLHSDDGGCGGVVVLHDVTARKRAEELTTASLREKEVLLKEIHHRVKNNLQIVSTLLDLQSGHTTDRAAIEMFKESRGRVKSMALIHERLYRSQDMARVNLGEYVRQLAADLHRTYRMSEGIRLELDVDVPPVAIDIAIPCGLLLNELISNCFKHAFADAAEGCLRVALHRDGGANVLTVADDGAGFPAGTDFQNTASFGLQLVNTLVDQLDGEISLTADRGTTFTVRFPKPSSTPTGTPP